MVKLIQNKHSLHLVCHDNGKNIGIVALDGLLEALRNVSLNSVNFKTELYDAWSIVLKRESTNWPIRHFHLHGRSRIFLHRSNIEWNELDFLLKADNEKGHIDNIVAVQVLQFKENCDDEIHESLRSLYYALVNNNKPYEKPYQYGILILLCDKESFKKEDKLLDVLRNGVRKNHPGWGKTNNTYEKTYCVFYDGETIKYITEDKFPIKSQ